MTRPSRRNRSNSRSGSSITNDEGIRHSSRIKISDKTPKQSSTSASNAASASGTVSNTGRMTIGSSFKSLEARLSNGKFVSVKVKLNGSRFRDSTEHNISTHRHESRRMRDFANRAANKSHPDNNSNTNNNNSSNNSINKRSSSLRQNGENYVQNTLGDDGNLYYCDVCREVGDVVCCDGCPRVYHPTCVPEESVSRGSLDADDDPWYCPTCMKEGKTSRRSGSEHQRGERGSRCKKMCVECHKSGGKMGQCHVCNASMHSPTCRIQDVGDQPSNTTCSNCLAEIVVDDEEAQRRIEVTNTNTNINTASKVKATTNNSKAIGASASANASLAAKGYASESSSEITPTPPSASLNNGKNNKNVKSSSQKNNDEFNHNNSSRNKGKHKSSKDHNRTPDGRPSKKLKRQKDDRSGSGNGGGSGNGNGTGNTDEQQQNSNSFKSMPSPIASPVKRSLPEKTTSPFFFFLMENRIKLERQLSRKNRTFKRMKGYQRNLLLAKEGALVWAKTTKLERKKYIDMSIQEFEYNVLTWKEDETLREMMNAEGNKDLDVCTLDSEEGNISDADITPKDNEYWDKKFDALAAPSQVSCRRIKSSTESIQNSVLLELLQDSRFHSLPMMKANRDCKSELQDNSNTAVPHFNVQGPLSTSIGDGCLGCIRGWNHFCPILKRQFPAVEHRAKLQPPCPSHLPVRIGIGLPVSSEDDQKYSYNDKKTYKELRFLSNPNTRGDEIVKLIETAMSVKLPVAKGSKQDEQSYSKKRKITNSKPASQSQELYECGRCKTATTSSMGCVTCRRVKLLVDLSKKAPSDKDNLTIQTVMLGRASARNDEFRNQTKGEVKIATGMVKRPWKPNAILPPMKKSIPPKYSPSNDDQSTSDDDSLSSSTSSSSETEENLSESENGLEISEVIEQPGTNDEFHSSEDDPVPKRRRLTRSAVSKTNEETSKIESNRQALAEVHKEEADILNGRCLSIATCGILLAMIRRDPLRLFAEPVPANVEGYHKIIKKPIDLSTMKDKVLKGQYSTLGSFMSDARLLCINSLVYNPPGTIYSMTAEEIQGVLQKMQKRASKWMCAIKNAHASHYARYQTQTNVGRKRSSSMNGIEESAEDFNGIDNDPFLELRQNWPGAAELLEDDGQWLRSQVEAEYVRTRENEHAYYATLAVRRAAKAAEASLSPIFESDPVFTPCIRRSHIDDEALRNYINNVVAKESNPVRITTSASWREQDVLELLKKVQKRRVETKTSPEDGCARCDKISIDDEANRLARETAVIRRKKKNDGVQVRVDDSRRGQSNGMASKRERDRVESSRSESLQTLEAKSATARDRSVTVCGSSIQGWGLFADHPFKKGELVAEYVGEYVVNPMADKREKFYEERRIQDYQFRVSANLVIDATKLGGHARYINHSCEPSCVAKIIDGDPPNKHLKRVVVTSQRDIQAGEEITYDYQFPLELDLDARIPCNCGSKSCRGFMNWDLPESGSLVARASTRQGRRDRIRRLVNKAL